MLIDMRLFCCSVLLLVATAVVLHAEARRASRTRSRSSSSSVTSNSFDDVLKRGVASADFGHRWSPPAATTKKTRKARVGHKRRAQTAQTQDQTRKSSSYRKWALRALNSYGRGKFSCQDDECYPPIGDLLLGRKNYLYASSTCGFENPEDYYVLGDARDRGFFDRNPFLPNRNPLKFGICDSTAPYDAVNNSMSHRVENIVYDQPVDVGPNGQEISVKWWQSRNYQENVYIQFDLEAEFTMTHIIMKFKTYPPAAMLIEKSSDFGRSWRTIAYYADECGKAFPRAPLEASRNLNEAYCTSKYSSTQYSTGTELLYRPLTKLAASRYLAGIDTAELESQLKVTNLRVNFTKLHMFGDNFLDNSDDIGKKYYYAVSEMRVFGSCSCNGHGSKCVRIKNAQYDYDRLNRMVHGRCLCQHNTDGQNCERCLPLYNNGPWRYGKSTCTRCECHDHADSCHFSDELYAQTNGASGGVCDNCKHNTEGVNCERCKINYYRDPDLPLNHPEVCKKCKCNHFGSVNAYNTGEGYACNSRECLCKKNVDGENCDRCKNGFFNLTLENPDGCQACPCVKEGTVDNLGCDKRTGQCYPCKTNVIGERCDTCAPGFYGLSDDKDGCRPCNCSIYGAYPVECNRVTGQCACKPNTEGRQCDKIADGHFCPALDYLTLEAESAEKLNDKAQVHERSEFNREFVTWTGTGFMRVYEGSRIRFNLDHVHATGYYSLLMRFEEYNSKELVDVRTKIIHVGRTFTNNSVWLKNHLPPLANCSMFQSRESREVSVNLYTKSRSSLIFNDYCFQQFHSYQIEMTFKNNQTYQSVYSKIDDIPTLLIDSIVVMPNIQLASVFNRPEADSARIEYMEERCHDYYLTWPKRGKNSRCESTTCAITIEYFGLLTCECDPIGSLSNICNFFDGQCECKNYVANRRCDRCIPGSWGFEYSGKGCQPCNCDPAGSMDSDCDAKTGDCRCHVDKTGKQCNKCFPGNYNFPKCTACVCNGMSQTCEDNGMCNDCRGDTEGFFCESCKTGFYGDPVKGVRCKKCQCPNINGNQFADTCAYNSINDTVRCNCQTGYSGARCDVCAVGYYGNPVARGGSCKKCNCNNNTITNDPAWCDRRTGECRNCLFNTDGWNCERCRAGYFGNALKKDCKQCSCNVYGTEGNSKANCDHETGICQCLPKVVGITCNECAENHWNLRSGKGCMSCDCDTSGTIANSTSCDEHTGQCQCVEGRGGKKCDECKAGYWGSPRTGCKQCHCNIQGSESNDCDKHTGECRCRKGIVGRYCDQCAKGYVGKAPNCRACGECFDNWAEIQSQISTEFDRLEIKALNTYASRGTHQTNLSDFYTQYESLENKLDDIYKILDYRQPRQDKKLFKLKQNLTTAEQELLRLKNVKKRYEQTFNRNAQSALVKIQKEFSVLDKNVTKTLRTAFQLKESFTNGAKTSIENSRDISKNASLAVRTAAIRAKQELQELLIEIEEKLKESQSEAEKYVAAGGDEAASNATSKYRAKLNELGDKLTHLNSLVCGGDSLDCSSKCGSSLCKNKCGFFSADEDENECSNSTNSLLKRHQHLAAEYKKLFEAKEGQFKKTLNRYYAVKVTAKKAHDDLAALNKSINATLAEAVAKKNSITGLYITADESLDKYQIGIGRLEANCKYVLEEAKLDLNEKILERNADKIKSLTSSLKEKVESLQRDTKKPSEDAEIFGRLVDEHEKAQSKDLPESLEKLHARVASLESVKQNLNLSVSEIEAANEMLLLNQTTLNDTLSAISNKLTIMDEGLNKSFIEPKPVLDGMEAFKSQSIDTLTIKLAQSQRNIDLSVETLGRVADDLQLLTDTIKAANTPEANEHFRELLELQMEILRKREMLAVKKARVDTLRKQKHELSSEVGEMKRELAGLKRRGHELKNAIKAKSDFLRACQ